MGLVQDFADAFNRRDVDALLACFTAEASYVDGFYGRHAGAAALRAMFERLFRARRARARPRAEARGALSMALSRAERAGLIAQYAAGPARLRAALAAVPAEALRWRPAPGEWSAHEIVCHCADSETSAYARIRLLLTEPEPTIQGYDQDAWARTLDYHAHPLAPPLAVVGAVRANTTVLLPGLGDEAWGRAGRHTES